MSVRQDVAVRVAREPARARARRRRGRAGRLDEGVCVEADADAEIAHALGRRAGRGVERNDSPGSRAEGA